MSATTDTTAIPAARAFDRTVADLKNGATAATEAYGAMSEKAAKTGSEFADFNRGTLEAMTEASQILAAGAQDLFRQMTTLSQTAFSEGLTSFRAIASAKTLREGMELQATVARTAAVWSVTESARMAREGIDLAEKAYAPVAARLFLAADKVGTFRV